MKHPTLVLVAALAAALLLAACGGAPPRAPAGRLDTPQHHVTRGNDLLDQGQLDAAERSFDQALSMNADYGPALSGKAVVVASRAARPGLPPEEKAKLTEQARDLSHRGVTEAQGDDQLRQTNTQGIRVFQLTKPGDNWLAQCEDHFENAVDLDPQGQDPDPYFFMARCYRDAFELDKAIAQYTAVLELGRGRTQQADTEMAELQKVRRAAPGTTHGKAIAFDPTITRADLSALFVEELQLAKLYKRDSPNRFNTGFQPANQRQFQADTLQRAPQATDIENHPLRADIEEVLRLGVLGLEADAAHLFHPDETVTRAEFALMVEDVLVKVTGETGLKTRFVGQASPFPDVRNDAYYFNAVQTVVSRNLMEPKEKLRGVFAPADPVTGAEALLVVRQMKDELRSYLR